MKLRFRPEVPADLDEAARWYDGRRAGLGAELLDAVANTLSRVEENPFLFPTKSGDVRLARIDHFPYGVFFYIHRDEVALVLAVMHLARHPRHWKQRRGY